MSGPIPPSEHVAAGNQNRSPVGTGPFRFTEWTSGDRILVEKFDGYRDADQINLDKITFRILPDTSTMLLNTRTPPLDDPRVRAAVAHAMNQDALTKIIWQNTRPVVTHSLGALKDCGDAGYCHYDPKAAKALINDYGKAAKIMMIHTATPRGRELGELMQ